MLNLMPDRSGIDWLPWCREAFARARLERKPILLSLVTTWAAGCAEMDRTTYADPTTMALIAATVIPVRVDADHRPDVADRYDLGGLPTTAFLTPAGEILGGGTFVSPERLRAAVSKAARAVERVLPAEAGVSSPAGRELDDATLTDIVFATFDDEHGGFGSAPKFPLAAPVRLAIDIYAENEAPAMLEFAVRTLDAMGWGPLFDETSGGFFRCASGADWSDPQPPKLLSTNALLLDLYVHAGEMLRQDRWFQRAADIVRYLDAACGPRAWPAADCGDSTTRFTDVNALAASAMLRAAAAFQDDAAGKRSLDVLEHVLLVSYKPGHGVAHSAKGARGLLSDQISMAIASLDAWESTGNIVYRMMAEELAHYALRTMWDDERGGLFDRDPEAEPVDPLPRAGKPFVLNCDAAVLLRRLAEATNDRMFATRAQETVAAMSAIAADSGPLAAHYLLARRAVLR
ncbi:MAG TPA: DUF255 domain-containing protein [Vicinamibacterales bacterium]|nr:DUF255 domain-containing protein [Vicinamibacterales bacterium]